MYSAQKLLYNHVYKLECGQKLETSKGLGKANLGNFNIDLMVIELTEI